MNEELCDHGYTLFSEKKIQGWYPDCCWEQAREIFKLFEAVCG